MDDLPDFDTFFNPATDVDWSAVDYDMHGTEGFETADGG